MPDKTPGEKTGIVRLWLIFISGLAIAVACFMLAFTTNVVKSSIGIGWLIVVLFFGLMFSFGCMGWSGYMIYDYVWSKKENR